ncbi:hypothetical protein ARMGADRAFT_1131201, partial [Armillaria gallica]
MAVLSGAPGDRRRVRQFRYMGLQQWRVGPTTRLLPILTSTSLSIFIVGLVVFLRFKLRLHPSLDLSHPSPSLHISSPTSCPLYTPRAHTRRRNPITSSLSILTSPSSLQSSLRFADTRQNHRQSRKKLTFVHFEKLWSTARTRWKR